MSSTQPAAATFKGATPASPETPIDEPETHSDDLIYNEGRLVTRRPGVTVLTYFVQLEGGTGIQVAAGHAGSHQRLSRGACNRKWGTSPLKKPEVLRYDDGTLIGDPFEGVTQHEERRVDQAAVDDPDDIEAGAAAKRGTQRSRCAIGSKGPSDNDRHANRTSFHHKSRHPHIRQEPLDPVCILAAPDETGLQQWRVTLSIRQYDHVTTIQSPSDFARALAGMVASQLGPRGGTDDLHARILAKQKTGHPSVAKVCFMVQLPT